MPCKGAVHQKSALVMLPNLASRSLCKQSDRSNHRRAQGILRTAQVGTILLL